MTEAELDRAVMAARDAFLAKLTEHVSDEAKDMLINSFDVAVVMMLQAQQTYYDRLDRIMELAERIGGPGAETPDPFLPVPDQAGDGHLPGG